MRRYCRMAARLAGCALVLFAIGCSGPQPAPDTRAADEAAIRQTNTAWSKTAEAKQLEAMVAYYADDASVFPPNAPIVTGKEAIRKVLAPLFEMPGFYLTWQATKVEVSRSGDLAYSSGPYEQRFNDPKGNPVTDRGKGVTVWKKQADGSWKAVADIFNSDLPPAAPTK